MIELGMIRDIVDIFGVIAAFTYYTLIVRNANRAREIETLLSTALQVDEKFSLARAKEHMTFKVLLFLGP